MGSGCGRGWRGCAGRGSSRRLGRSGQQWGGGLAGAHWSMLNRGADEATKKDNRSRAPLCRVGAVAAAEAGWAEVTSLTVNRAGSSRRLSERAPPQPRAPRRKGSDHRADHRNFKNILKPTEIPLHDSPFSTCIIKTVWSKSSLNYQPSFLPHPVFLLLSLFPVQSEISIAFAKGLYKEENRGKVFCGQGLKF